MAILLHHGPLPASGDTERTPVRFETVVVVLPTKRRIRHLTREVVRNTGAVPELPFHTLESLARALHQALPGTPRIITGSVQRLLFHAAIRDASAGLRYFRVRGSEQQLFRGTFEQVVDVINNLKEAGVYPGVLREEALSAPLDEQAKLLDVAAIYEAYERRLLALKADDVPGVFRVLSLDCPPSRFDEAFRSLFPAAATVSLAGFDEFTRPEIGFITRLCAVSGLGVSLLFDFLPGNSGLFGHLEENYAMFRDLGFSGIRILPEREDVAVGVPQVNHTPAVQIAAGHLAATLFHPDPSGTRADLSRHVSVIRAKSRQHEVEIIAKLIKRLLHDRPGLEPASICVAMVRPQPYTDIMRATFPKYGVPVNITDRFELARSPVVSSIMAVLQVPLNGFRRDDVLRAAQSPYCTPGNEGEPVDAGNLERVSRELRIVAGYRNWLDRIRRRNARISDERDRAAGNSARDDLDAVLRSLRKAERDIGTIESATRELLREQPPEEFRRLLLALLRRLQIDANLVRHGLSSDPELIERDVRATTKFREVIDEMTRLLQFQEETPVPHGLRFYVDQLKTAITGERYNVREQFGRGVLVTSIEETRGLPVDVMIVAGLVDGEFPSVYQPEVFLSASRQQLRERRHIWQNRYLFYQAVTNWSTHLYLTDPERDGDLDLVRSPFIEAVVKVAAVEEFRGAGEIPWLPDFSSEEELLAWCGEQPDGYMLPDGDIPDPVRAAVGEVHAAITVERSRLENHSLPEYDGFILGALSPESRAGIASLRSRAYSASQLETYGKCPFRFFADRLLRLRPVAPFDEDLSPLERGSILHEALFEFFTARREGGMPPLAGCSDAEYNEAVAHLSRILESKLTAVDIPDAFWSIERELILGSGGSGGLVRDFLAHERARTEETVPAYFEVAFGLPEGAAGATDSRLSAAEPLRVGELLLVGKVDRIEAGNGFFVIVDYKTGSTVPTIRDIRSGLSLQLPLYLAAVESLLRQQAPMQPAGGLYYMIRDPVKLQLGIGSRDFLGRAFEAGSRSGQLLEGDEELRAEINGALARGADIVQGIGAGKFPLTTPDKIEKVCGSCDFKTMCRIQNFRHVQSQIQEEA